MITSFQITGNDRVADIKMDIDETFSADADLMTFLHKGNSPEPELIWLMSRVLHEGDYAVDGGANTGIFTLLMAYYVGKSGQVLAIEPGPNNLPRLLQNLRLNDAGNVVICSRALWSSAGEIDFYLYSQSGYNSHWPSEPDHVGNKIEAVTLDSLVERTPRLIKLDIEGAEFEALQGANETLARHPLFIVAEINSESEARTGHSPEQLRRLMKFHGYEAFIMQENGTLPAFVPHNSRLTPKRLNGNVLFSTMDDVGAAWAEVVW